MRVGEAYAFFNCSATLDHIRREMPLLRHLSLTPVSMDVFITNKLAELRPDYKLREKIDLLGLDRLRYSLHARQLSSFNPTVADEVHHLLRRAQQSELFVPGEESIATILYEVGPTYIVRR